jgi:trehalose synthase
VEVTEFPKKTLEEYRGIVGDEKIEQIREKARPFQGLRMAHVNSTSFGGGVAEILVNFVPLLRDVGIETRWYVIEGPTEFFNITKRFHNALQGNQALHLSESDRELYMKVNEENALRLALDEDAIIIHDPQPAAMIRFARKSHQTWYWRCHIDVSAPNMAYWGFLSPLVQEYDFVMFHRPDYVREELQPERTIIMPPSIDPLSPKNNFVPHEEVHDVLLRFGLDPRRPLLVQVGRFDPWKGLFDVIDIYRLVREDIPEVQLALVGIMASDDPEAWVYFERTLRRLGEDAQAIVATNLTGAFAHEVNAFQRAATLVFQMSTREGFGLTVSEAMWKYKPVIGRSVGGIRLQIVDGETGFLVADHIEGAARADYLLRHPEVADEMGLHAHERVLNSFLIVSQLERYLDMLERAKTATAA